LREVKLSLITKRGVDRGKNKYVAVADSRAPTVRQSRGRIQGIGVYRKRELIKRASTGGRGEIEPDVLEARSSENEKKGIPG